MDALRSAEANSMIPQIAWRRKSTCGRVGRPGNAEFGMRNGRGWNDHGSHSAAAGHNLTMIFDRIYKIDGMKIRKERDLTTDRTDKHGLE